MIWYNIYIEIKFGQFGEEQIGTDLNKINKN